MGDYYSVKKIMHIIKYYHINISNLQIMKQEDMKSVGVMEYGIESSMPSGSDNALSSVVENEVMRRVNNSRYYSEVITDIKYLQERWHRVEDEREAVVLQMRLDGYSSSDIGSFMHMQRSGVHRMLERIAQQIKGYPQNKSTDSTHSTD